MLTTTGREVTVSRVGRTFLVRETGQRLDIGDVTKLPGGSWKATCYVPGHTMTALWRTRYAAVDALAGHHFSRHGSAEGRAA